jgi:hypothetical protein
MAVSAVAAQEKPPTEKEKIEGLIKHVEGLKEVKFIRNDQEYDAKAAGKFLRGKWEAREKEVKTVDDFIEKVASKSSTTGKPYLLRFKEGKEVKGGEYLRAEHKKREKKE